MIDKIEPYFNGGLLLELKGGEKIEVSRSQTVKFKEMMSLFESNELILILTMTN